MAEFLRPAWGARPPKATGPALNNEPYGVVHDIGGGDPYPSSVVATLQQIQSSEQHGDYVDIAYNWGVDKDGNQWQLRGDVEDGATKGYAGRSFSVLAICNASAPNFVPTPALVAGIAACFRNAQDRGVLAHGAYIDSHHWFDSHVTRSPTACCGAGLIPEIPQIQRQVAHPKPAAPTPVFVEEEPLLVPSNNQPLTNPFHGAKIDIGKQLIVARGGASINPNPSVIGNKPWDGVYVSSDDPSGVATFTVVTTDEDKYRFRVA